jgi:tetratricopeptide (TPR) repeat protein
VAQCEIGDFSLITGNPNAAIQELTPLEGKRDFTIVWYLAMSHFHRKCQHIGKIQLIDNEVLDALTAKYTIAKESANFTEKQYLYAGLFSFYVHNYEAASEYFRLANDLNPSSLIAMLFIGEIELVQTGETALFDTILEKSQRDIGAMLLKGLSLRNQKKHAEALDMINKIIAYYPNFIPAHIERLRILLDTHSWEALLDGAQRLGGLSVDNIDSLHMICMHELCCEGATPVAATFIKTLEKV